MFIINLINNKEINGSIECFNSLSIYVYVYVYAL